MTIRQNIEVKQGETFSFVYTHLDAAGSVIDLTGYTARMAIRKYYNAAHEAYLSTGSDADGGTITLGGGTGTVTLAMTAVQTAALAEAETSGINILLARDSGMDVPSVFEKRRKFIYDLELVNGATITRALEGELIVHREVTT